ncbi:unnamed protein product, partial [Prorocentrum cordatum]
MDDCDVLVVGSRGGQVVLPNLWAWGAKVPPAVVINGGCAMNLPTQVFWPDHAITFLLMGGQDNFRGDFSHEDPPEYLEDAISRVPPGNGTTAILYVNEMQHMPQAPLLAAVLPHMLLALLRWQESRAPPLHEFRPLLAALNRDGWSGRLLHTRSPGNWEDVTFSPVEVARACRSGPARSWVPELERRPQADRRPPVELSRKDELKALWRAAAAASLPRGGAPKTEPTAHFAALVQAAVAQATPQLGAGQRPKPLLPISVAGHGDPKALRAGRTPAHQ